MEESSERSPEKGGRMPQPVLHDCGERLRLKCGQKEGTKGP